MFSLRELARMEEERVREQGADAQRERDARLKVEREVAERARREAEARERAEVEGQLEMARRAREEQARVDALQRAAVESARVAADARARAEERERERAHELEVERARVAAGTERLRSRVLGAVVGVTLGAGGATGACLVLFSGREQARMEASSAEVAVRDGTIRDLRATAEATQARLLAGDESLASMRAARDRLQGELDDARRPTGHRTASPRSTVAQGQTHAAETRLDGFATCAPGSKDPMCAR